MLGDGVEDCKEVLDDEFMFGRYECENLFVFGVFIVGVVNGFDV